ncbi:MAG: OmpA family protein, partial [Pseudomonadota bacterium]
SEFFGRLREILGDRDDVRIAGDRFVFQAEVLFAPGSNALGPAGDAAITALADGVTPLIADIPADFDWYLRVDGHTDDVPIANERFRSNWALSTARALSVVNRLVAAGLPPQRLAAAGFGEFRPAADNATADGRARNRRIEIVLDQRPPTEP